MMAVVATMVFLGALTLAVAAMWMTVAPQWQRVIRLALGEVELPLRLGEQHARAEDRKVVRQWAAVPVPVPARRLRVA